MPAVHSLGNRRHAETSYERANPASTESFEQIINSIRRRGSLQDSQLASYMQTPSSSSNIAQSISLLRRRETRLREMRARVDIMAERLAQVRSSRSLLELDARPPFTRAIRGAFLAPEIGSDGEESLIRNNVQYRLWEGKWLSPMGDELPRSDYVTSEPCPEWPVEDLGFEDILNAGHEARSRRRKEPFSQCVEMEEEEIVGR